MLTLNRRGNFRSPSKIWCLNFKRQYLNYSSPTNDLKRVRKKSIPVPVGAYQAVTARLLYVTHWRLFLAASRAIENHSASQTSLFISTGLRKELRSALTRSRQVHFMPPLGRFQSGPFTNSRAEFGRVVGSWRNT